ncbi:hypothetical protein [Caldisericum exile]|nr:hypothetical protein [Caldisericum exile]
MVETIAKIGKMTRKLNGRFFSKMKYCKILQIDCITLYFKNA